MSEQSAWIPEVDAPDFAGFWIGCREGRIRILRCGRSHLFWPPRPVCPRCQDTHLQWHEVEGTGWLFSWTVVHRTALPEFHPLVPYVVGVIELTDHPGVRLLGRCLTPPSALKIGIPMHVVFERVTDSYTRALWEVDGLIGCPGDAQETGGES